MLNRHRVGKHLKLSIADGLLEYERKTPAIEHGDRTDGCHTVRTSEGARTLSAEDTARTAKSLGQVEQAFRCTKRVDLHIRFIHHPCEL